MIEKMFIIIAEDGRTFIDMSENVETLLKRIKIPVKAIYEGGVLVWQKQTN